MNDLSELRAVRESAAEVAPPACPRRGGKGVRPPAALRCRRSGYRRSRDVSFGAEAAPVAAPPRPFAAALAACDRGPPPRLSLQAGHPTSAAVPSRARASRRPVPGRQRGVSGSARSRALRPLTRRDCPSAANEVSAARAARPRSAHAAGVGEAADTAMSPRVTAATRFHRSRGRICRPSYPADRPRDRPRASTAAHAPPARGGAAAPRCRPSRGRHR